MATKKSSGSRKKRPVPKRNIKSTSKKRIGADHYNAYLVTTLIISMLLTIFVYFSSDGSVNKAVKNVVFFIFGWTGFLVPFAFAGLFIYLVFNRNIKRFWIKFTQTILALFNLSSIIGLGSQRVLWIDDAYDTVYNNIGSGYIGFNISSCLKQLIQKPLSYVVLIILLVILVSLIVSFPLKQYIVLAIDSLTSRTNGSLPKRSKPKRRQEAEVSEAYEDEPDYDYGYDEFFDEQPEKEPDPPVKPAKKEKKSKKTPVEKTVEEEFTDGIDEIFGDSVDVPEDMPVVDKTVSTKSPVQTAEPTEAVEEVKETVKEEVKAEKPKREKKNRSAQLDEEEKRSFSETLDSALENTAYVEYEFPPIELLHEPEAAQSDLRSEMRQTAERLIKVLSDFGVKAKLLQVSQGPAVTRYEIQPDTGTKLSKITGLSDDIAMNLAVSTALVAPVPGKVAVGIEVPNKNVSAVMLRELIESPEFKRAKSKLAVVIGKDIAGNAVIGDIAKWPHILIAGQTGSGKSVAVNSMIVSLLYNATPEDVRLILIDPKVVEFKVYNGIPHLLIPVVTEAKKAAGALNWAVGEMMRRYELLDGAGVRKLENYNRLMEERGEEKLPQIVIVIDELADLMMVAAKEVEDYICRLAQLARAAGIHLIVATQRPSVDVVTGLIKANIPSRMALNVSSQVDSRTIIDKGGAEKLLGNGDMLYFPTGARSAMRLQGAFVDDREIENIVSYIKERSGETHYSEDLEDQIERCALGENGVTPDVEEDGDPLLQDAISLAVELGKISTSMIQRRLGVGYARAGRLVDQMEARGIISGANGSKPRDVLVSHADLAGAYETAAEEFGDEE